MGYREVVERQSDDAELVLVMREGSFISIDPGCDATGVALWDDAKLVSADLIESEKSGAYFVRDWRDIAIGVRRFIRTTACLVAVIEFPVIYESRAKSKADPNDLLKLAGLVGAITQSLSLICPVKLVTPVQWKGQRPKSVIENRCLVELNNVEKSFVPKLAKSKQHNVWDAVGIGLRFLFDEKLRTSKVPALDFTAT